MTFTHLDDAGAPCALHAPASTAAVAALAAIGSRVAAFNHDIASKLQGLMMALDEISELVEGHGDSALRPAVDTAHLTLRELSALLAANRALTRASARTATTVAELVRGAGERVGVAVRGELPATPLAAVPPLVAIAIGLALDAAADTGRARAVDVTVTAGALVIPLGAHAPANASDALGIAAHVLAGAGGALCCGRDRTLRITLPAAAAAVAP